MGNPRMLRRATLRRHTHQLGGLLLAQAQLCSAQPSDHVDQRRSENSDNVLKFDHIKTALTGLILADERLGHLKPFGHLHLGKASFPAQLTQQRTQLLVLLRVDGFLHAASAPCRIKYPNSGYLKDRRLQRLADPEDSCHSRRHSPACVGLSQA